MANLFDLCSTQSEFQKLHKIKDTLQKEQDAERERIAAKRKQIHDKTHIFTTYDEALDYMEQHPNESIHWHGWDVRYDGKEKIFKSVENHSDVDGINFWNERHKYTREELIKDVQKIREHIISRYPEEKDKKFWLDEYGKLDHVYLYNNSYLD